MPFRTYKNEIAVDQVLINLAAKIYKLASQLETFCHKRVLQKKSPSQKSPLKEFIFSILTVLQYSLFQKLFKSPCFAVGSNSKARRFEQLFIGRYCNNFSGWNNVRYIWLNRVSRDELNKKIMRQKIQKTRTLSLSLLIY